MPLPETLRPGSIACSIYHPRLQTFEASAPHLHRAAARTAWQKQTWAGFAPYSQGLYANLNAAQANVKARSACGANLERLIEVKTHYDPKNLLHLNPNIVPLTGGRPFTRSQRGPVLEISQRWDAGVLGRAVMPSRL